MAISLKEFITAVEPFSRLPASEIDDLVLMARRVEHAKGETVYSEGDEAKGVYILENGRLEIFKYSSSGRPTAIESIMPKGIYGMYCRIGNPSCGYPCTAVASLDSTSIFIPDHIFWGLFSRQPIFVAGVCTLCSQRLNGMQELVINAQEPVEKRIVRTLMNLSQKNGHHLRFTKREIAELSSTTVETAIRTLSTFEKKRWISSERGSITLKDITRLENILN